MHHRHPHLATPNIEIGGRGGRASLITPTHFFFFTISLSKFWHPAVDPGASSCIHPYLLCSLVWLPSSPLAAFSLLTTRKLFSIGNENPIGGGLCCFPALSMPPGPPRDCHNGYKGPATLPGLLSPFLRTLMEVRRPRGPIVSTGSLSWRTLRRPPRQQCKQGSPSQGRGRV